MAKQKNLMQEEIKRMTLQQGQHVSAVLDMPGWAIIENAIRTTKFQMEQDRQFKLSTDPNGSKALYFSGKVDGAEMVRSNIYQIVEAARQISANQEITNETDR